ncbi:Nitrate reductase NADH [Hondaea fermentalgiana]|uniref:Nitrate reductase NADH n=1 Tax=Hondaea fermentalgiana TaxID=2315210 RepID=A0A2R5G2B2_9STRA|nr:Nitrate reductase NADH [Hondaea fermentalgiana]|eukprot:GBG23868.1 Nitrate reductase NADH [Hondaea fermentalgiana]
MQQQHPHQHQQYLPPSPRHPPASPILLRQEEPVFRQQNLRFANPMNSSSSSSSSSNNNNNAQSEKSPPESYAQHPGDRNEVAENFEFPWDTSVDADSLAGTMGMPSMLHAPLTSVPPNPPYRGGFAQPMIAHGSANAYAGRPGEIPHNHNPWHSPLWERAPSPYRPSGENSSLDVFMEFCAFYCNRHTGEVYVNASGILTKPCFTKWLETRQGQLKRPEEAFRKTITAHCTGTDGRKPFLREVEAAVLIELRRQNVWPCFADRTTAKGDPINIGQHGFRGQGYHENLRLPENMRKSRRNTSAARPRQQNHAAGTSDGNGPHSRPNAPRAAPPPALHQQHPPHPSHPQFPHAYHAPGGVAPPPIPRPRPPPPILSGYNLNETATTPLSHTTSPSPLKAEYSIADAEIADPRDSKRKRAQSGARSAAAPSPFAGSVSSGEDGTSCSEAGANTSMRFNPNAVPANRTEWSQNPNLVVIACETMGIPLCEFDESIQDEAIPSIERVPDILRLDHIPLTLRAAGLRVMTKYFRPHHFLSLMSIAKTTQTDGIFDNRITRLPVNLRDPRFARSFLLPDADLVPSHPVGRNIFCLNTFMYISSDHTARTILEGAVEGSPTLKFLHPLQFWMVVVHVIPMLMERGELVWQSFGNTYKGKPMIARSKYKIVGDTVHTCFQNVSHLYPNLMAMPSLGEVRRRRATSSAARATALVFGMAEVTTEGPTALGFPVNALRIPNGRAFPAAGHSEGVGGGPLSPFGIDFLACDGQWSACLCGRDSDGDGETNGMELGDPCCVWQPDDDFPPQRRDQLSDPSRADSLTSLSVDADSISCDGSNQDAAQDSEARPHWGFSFSDLVRGFLDFVTSGILLYLAVLVVRDWQDLHMQRLQRANKEKVPVEHASWWWTMALPIIFAYLWGDLGSAISHVVLDNPEVLHRWPILRQSADSFQEHHIDPTKLSAPPLCFLLPLVFLAASSTNARLRWCTLAISAFFELAYVGHWYSHVSETWASAPLLNLVFVSHAHHNVHHTTFASNFAFLSGYTDPFANALLLLVPQKFVGTWFFLVGGLWSLMPRILFHAAASIKTWSRRHFRVLALVLVLGTATTVYMGQMQETGYGHFGPTLDELAARHAAAEAATPSQHGSKSNLANVQEATSNSNGALSHASGQREPPAGALFSAAEVAKHQSAHDAWIVLGRDVLDVTRWLDFHPGGKEIMLPYLGYNATETFDEQGHSDVAIETTRMYRIGTIHAGEIVPSAPVDDGVDDVDETDSLGLKRRVFRQPVQGEPCFGPPTQLAREGEWELDAVAPFSEKYARGRSKTFGTPHSSELAMRLSVDLALLTPPLLQTTPASAFYIRTGLPGTLDAMALSRETWKVQVQSVSGQILHTFSAQEIHDVGSHVGTGVMECSGNTRVWHFGLLSQAQWTRGVRVRDLLKDYLPAAGASSDGRAILVEGYDEHIKTAGGAKGASWVFTWDQVISTGMFFATELNGEPLPPNHGFPIRLVVPNWYGCTCIKWVRLVKFVDARRVKPTGQMNEFRTRVHMQKAPSTMAYGWHAKQGLSAAATRVEQWRHVTSNATYLKIVGLMWGGQEDAVNPRLEIELRSQAGAVVLSEPLQVVKPRSLITEWTSLCHSIPLRMTRGSRYTVTFRPVDPTILAPRLRSKTRGVLAWYARSFQLL